MQKHTKFRHTCICTTVMVRDRPDPSDGTVCDSIWNLTKTRHRETKSIPVYRCRPDSKEYPQMQFDAGQGCDGPCPDPMCRSRVRLVDGNCQKCTISTKWKGIGNVKKHRKRYKKWMRGPVKSFRFVFLDNPPLWKTHPSPRWCHVLGGSNPTKHDFPSNQDPGEGPRAF